MVNVVKQPFINSPITQPVSIGISATESASAFDTTPRLGRSVQSCCAGFLEHVRMVLPGIFWFGLRLARWACKHWRTPGVNYEYHILHVIGERPARNNITPSPKSNHDNIFNRSIFFLFFLLFHHCSRLET